jgi:hypothetical protein
MHLKVSSNASDTLDGNPVRECCPGRNSRTGIAFVIPGRVFPSCQSQVKHGRLGHSYSVYSSARITGGAWPPNSPIFEGLRYPLKGQTNFFRLAIARHNFRPPPITLFVIQALVYRDISADCCYCCRAFAWRDR